MVTKPGAPPNFHKSLLQSLDELHAPTYPSYSQVRQPVNCVDTLLRFADICAFACGVVTGGDRVRVGPLQTNSEPSVAPRS